jgi:hypothetical protein
MINIKGLNKAKVLAALYNASKPLGLGILQYDPKDMSEKEAAELLKEQSYFDYLKGRVMKVDLSSDKEFDERLYDRDNGIGAAKEAINGILKEEAIVIKRTPKFELGRLVLTTGVDTKMKADSSFKTFVQLSLDRYGQCDWGDTCDEDKQTADESLRDGERILAVYEHKDSNTKIWIITEWDRSVTTILFPHEY